MPFSRFEGVAGKGMSCEEYLGDTHILGGTSGVFFPKSTISYHNRTVDIVRTIRSRLKWGGISLARATCACTCSNCEHVISTVTLSVFVMARLRFRSGVVPLKHRLLSDHNSNTKYVSVSVWLWLRRGRGV